MSFKLENSTVYFNEEFVPFNDANLSIASSPVLYGLTIYTVFSIKWDDNQKKLNAFRLKDHYKRLINSARIMDFHDFAESYSYNEFERNMIKLIKLNAIKEDVLVRVAVYIDEIVAGTKIHGLKNSVSAYIYPFGQILNPGGINVCVSSWVRTQDNAQPSRAKINGSYINASLMKNEALLNGYDDAIALDHNGHVSEGTVANLFLVRDGVLITPDNSTDLLEGITRSSIMDIAKDQGIPTESRAVDRSELYIADEVFMCGSSARIVPVLSIDKRPIGNGKSGEITQKLSKIYDDIQSGSNDKFTHWIKSI
ncbi:branched-chain amino acid transaminase [Candidatus Nomurabacteria bacterium]|nr:branched-chain amino acid transaminase [Candidatus Nomurabacteria bacterium]